MLRLLFSLILILNFLYLWSPENYFSQKNYNGELLNLDERFLKDVDEKWVDSVFSSLSEDEKIAQLMIISVYSNRNEVFYSEISSIIKKYNVGGVCFFQGGPVMQAILTNRWQKEAKTPLLVTVDGEWGLGMRLKDSAVSFPRQMTLGAIQNDSLIYEMGVEIAKHMKRIGVHINFAPVFDINNNRLNPVINSRSFGEDKYNVARKGIMYMKGMQDNGILATGKHFPGHGDTRHDSHYTLPVINHDWPMIDTFDLYPFKEAIKKGLGSVMTAHLFIPVLDSTPNLAASLSPIITNNLLVNKLGFDGLIMTDGLAMKGVADYFKPGELEVKALLAGNDILLLPENVPVAINAIKKAIADSVLSQEDINRKCRKVLAYKYKLGLAQSNAIIVDNIYQDVNPVSAELINKKLYREAITIVKNNNNILPLNRLDTLRLASVSLGVGKTTHFQKVMGNYAKIDNYVLGKKPGNNEIQVLLNKLKNYNLVIVGIHNTNNSVKENYGVTFEQISFVNILKKNVKVVINVFANPYSLASFSDIDGLEAIVVSYQSNDYAEDASAQVIFGGLPAKGLLPVSASELFPAGTGFISQNSIRLNYTSPEDFNINSSFAEKVDSLINSAIADKAFPGCQILYACQGSVFFNKSYGMHTYDADATAVSNTDLYDIASLTKVLATTVAVMKLYDNGLINLDKPLGEYLDFLKGSDKAHLKIRAVMAHQAGFKAWIPFYKETLTDFALDSSVYQSKPSLLYSIKVAENIYIRNDYQDTIFMRLIASPLNKSKKYLYSDLGFFLLKLVVERVSGQAFDKYLDANFYKPLGLSELCFNPLQRVPSGRIVPTENDTIFRKQLVHGYVHDPVAAMLGGIAGNAGLFSNSNDIAIMLQMLLQNGIYGGTQYLKTNTVKEFTKYQFPENNNRRGLGFDKPVVNINNRQTCKSASLSSYGHSGFTGTYFWVDPELDYLFVFLSNRVYPDPNNDKLRKSDLRSVLHQLGYDAIMNSKMIKKFSKS